MITDKFAADFEESVPAAESTVAQAGFSRRAEVFGAGVSVIDSDSATALVAGSFTNSYPDPEDLDGERTGRPAAARSGCRSSWSRSTASGWSTASPR